MGKYQGIEVGPIRPPSESQSLMIRITRNCPWNKCKFCGLYNGTKFSIRSTEDVIKDIDKIKQIVSNGKNKDVYEMSAGGPVTLQQLEIKYWLKDM